jgi:glycosyltransferase involved in cell wall biosynthesis
MKKKVVILSDHALSTSGVGTQTRHLVSGLLEKNKYTFRQFGAALKHASYDTIKVDDDFIIKPIDGFGNPDLIRVTLAAEKPDVLFIFTDPRFFLWLFEIEDEIHQVCPIAWWHVWDNTPYPEFNDPLYESTDLINCHSHHTYTQLKDRHPSKTNFIPHAVPKNIFKKINKEDIQKHKISLLGEERKDWFVGIWVNRNAKRKRSSDTIVAWKQFLDNLEKEHGHRNALLIMHCDPHDPEGSNLIQVSEAMDVQENVFFSTQRLDFENMNVLYNISDFCINISYAEGFGLSTLESMQCGTPIIAVKTGGLTRQVIDHRDGTENGVSLPVELQTLVGSQTVPYIYEDYVSNETIANGIMKLYNMSDEEKEILCKKVLEYVDSEFNLKDVVDKWDETLTELIGNWKENYKRYEVFSM